MKFRQSIHEYLCNHRQEITDTLQELIRIPSVRGEACTGSPFGKACTEALQYTKSLYSANWFETELISEGGYLLSYCGEGDQTIGLFAHADVVPAGHGWILTNPFEPLEKDGWIIGRGATDDKSAVISSLYCAKMIKELNLPFESRLVCFTGANEESGMQDIQRYVREHKPPDFSLVCDTAFPLYHGDKGILQFTATQKAPMKDVTDFSGGMAFNLILGEARAEIGEKCLTAKGISRHGALPEGSLNAGYLLAEELLQKGNLCNHDREQMQWISAVLKTYDGAIFGIDQIDRNFGKLTVTNGLASMKDGKISLGFDLRYGASADIQDIKIKLHDFFDQSGWTVEWVREAGAFFLAEDDPYLEACLNAYRRFTNSTTATPSVNAGGTYARYLPRAVEIGTSLNGGTCPFELPAGHGGVHQPDESISIHGLIHAIEMTMHMLLACDQTMKHIRSGHSA